MSATLDRSPRAILIFWLPLALQWIMMAAEGPFLAAVIARLADPTFNLAAYGVAFAFAILVESPVIMLMSASTALVEDSKSYRKLRAFTAGLNIFSTALLVLLLLPPVFTLILRTALGLPPDIADLVYGALWILLPWPAAIGYRRFLHGLMIRAGRTRRIMLGTMIRLVGMAVVGLLLATIGIPGAWVGAGALSAGVVIEAIVAHLMSRDVVADLLATDDGDAGKAATPVSSGDPADIDLPASDPELLREAEAATGSVRALGEAGRVAAEDAAAEGSRTSKGGEADLGYGYIARFYYPLALMALIGLTMQPILTFFMGRAPSPVESLALFPVIMALNFLFGSLGLSYQEVAITLVGRKGEYRRELGRFAAGLAVVAAGGLGLIVYTPLARVWFEGVSGLDPAMASLALVPARIIALAPALAVILSYQRALLVQARKTRPITIATVVEVVTVMILFPLLGWKLGWMGVTAAAASLLAGRILGMIYLSWQVRGLFDEPPVSLKQN